MILDKQPLYYYERALEFFLVSEEGTTDYTCGICHALTIAATDLNINEKTKYFDFERDGKIEKIDYYYHMVKGNREFFKDFYMFEPFGVGAYWFPLTKKGRQTRIKLLRSIIKKIKSKNT